MIATSFKGKPGALLRAAPKSPHTRIGENKGAKVSSPSGGHFPKEQGTNKQRVPNSQRGLRNSSEGYSVEIPGGASPVLNSPNVDKGKRKEGQSDGAATRKPFHPSATQVSRHDGAAR